MANQQDSPHHHSSKPSPVLAIIIGIVGGVALFGGVMYWYFHGVEQPAPPLPGQPIGSAGQTSGGPVVDFTVFDIEPLAEMHLKVVNGEVESVEAPADSGLMAKVDGKTITVKAVDGAKEGTHMLKIKGPKGKETTVTVHVKKKK